MNEYNAMYTDVKNVLHRLSTNNDFLDKWHNIINSCDLNLYQKATQQEDLLVFYGGDLFSILKFQRQATYNNLVYGDLYIKKYKTYLDLKVAADTTSDDLCGVINETSLRNFVSSGWYLCINKSFTKFVLFSKEEIYNKYKNGMIKLLVGPHDNFIPSYQYENIENI